MSKNNSTATGINGYKPWNDVERKSANPNNEKYPIKECCQIIEKSR
jgi:hypothetical protein